MYRSSWYNSEFWNQSYLQIDFLRDHGLYFFNAAQFVAFVATISYGNLIRSNVMSNLDQWQIAAYAQSLVS